MANRDAAVSGFHCEMHLDIPTLMVMGSFVSACSGSILLGAWLFNQKTPILGLWGAANLAVACGVALLIAGRPTHELPLTDLAAVVLALSSGMMWLGARLFAGKLPVPALAFVGGLVVAVLRFVPTAEGFLGHTDLLIGPMYLLAAAFTFWDLRKLQLPARWPLVIFIAVHASVLLCGYVGLLNGAPERVPPLMSLFGVIHFEAIVFSVGTTALILAIVKERSEAASKLIANLDSLTGIANRAAFMAGAEKILARCRRDKLPVSVIMFDLDHFKSVNDNHGHAIGDAVIRKFCEIAGGAIRHHDVLGRIGGEEFAAVLSRSSIEPAMVRADRIRAAFAENCRSIQNHEVNATVSGGVTTSENAETTLSALLEQADEALYRAKAAGRNRVKRAGQGGKGHTSDVIRVA